jgi:lactate racemase
MASNTLPYGNAYFSLPHLEQAHVEWIEPAYTPPAPDPIQEVREALQNPVDGHPLADYRGVKSAAIAINDKTRPVPHEHLLPPLLDALRDIGLADSEIRFFIATGTHLPMLPEEFDRILPAEIISRYQIFSHNCDDEANLVNCGQTSRGTLVRANRQFLSADLRIVVGNIEPHHFAGFSGGHKTAAIGLTSRVTINHNHAMLADPGARIAAYDGNPLRADIDEIGEAMGVHFALNAILNGEKKIVQVVAGSPLAVMQAGIPISAQVCQTSVTEKFDMVIASAGGAPKDINFYQSQKALTHASLFTRDGGVIILISECPEGVGSPAYEAFMEGVESPQAAFEKFRHMGFRVGPHKAFQVARDAARVSIIMVSNIPAERVSRLLMTPAATLQEAVDLGLARLGAQGGLPRIAVLPRATNTIPV